jgi:hypothetical protein
MQSHVEPLAWLEEEAGGIVQPRKNPFHESTHLFDIAYCQADAYEKGVDDAE